VAPFNLLARLSAKKKCFLHKAGLPDSLCLAAYHKNLVSSPISFGCSHFGKSENAVAVSESAQVFPDNKKVGSLIDKDRVADYVSVPK